MLQQSKQELTKKAKVVKRAYFSKREIYNCDRKRILYYIKIIWDSTITSRLQLKYSH